MLKVDLSIKIMQTTYSTGNRSEFVCFNQENIIQVTISFGAAKLSQVKVMHELVIMFSYKDDIIAHLCPNIIGGFNKTCLIRADS